MDQMDQMSATPWDWSLLYYADSAFMSACSEGSTQPLSPEWPKRGGQHRRTSALCRRGLRGGHAATFLPKRFWPIDAPSTEELPSYFIVGVPSTSVSILAA